MSVMLSCSVIEREVPVKLLTGKYRDRRAVFICWTKKHPLSSKRRAQVQVQTGLGWKTLLVNEGNKKRDDIISKILDRDNWVDFEE